MHERALKGATMQSKFIPRRRLPWVAAAATLTAVLMLVVGLGTASAHDPVFGVQPAIVQDTVPPGGDLVVNKTVHTPVVPPTPDIFFVFDTTGSMGDDIATVQAKLGDLITAVDGLTLDAQFGVAKYEDYPFAPWGLGTNVAYDLLQPITGDATAVTNAINALATFPGSGGDVPESRTYWAHRETSPSSASSRPSSRASARSLSATASGRPASMSGHRAWTS